MIKNLFSFILIKGLLCIALFFIANIAIAQTKDEIREQQFEKIKKYEKAINHKKVDVLYVEQHIELSRLYSSVRMHEKGLEIGKKAFKTAKALNHAPTEASAASTLGSIYFELQDYETALPYLETADEELSKLQQYDDLSFNHRFLAQTYLFLGDTTSAIKYHEKTLALSEQFDIPHKYAFSCDFLGNIYFHSNDFIKAISYYEKSLDIYLELGWIQRISLSAGNIGLAKISLGNEREAIHYLTMASKYYKIDNNIEGQVWMNSLISDIYKKIGEYSTALNYNDKNRAIFQKPINEVGLAEAYRQRGEILAFAHEFKKAEQYLNKAWYLFDQHDLIRQKAGVQLSRAELFFIKGDYNIALDYLTKAEDLNKLDAYDVLMNSIHRIKGGIFAKQGKGEEAKKYLNKSLAYYQAAQSASQLPFIYQHLYIADSVLNNHESALENFKLYTHYYLEENKDNFDTERIAYQFEFEKKEAIAQAQLETKNVQRNAAIIGLVFLILLILILIYFYRLRQKKIEIEKENIDLQKREVEQIKKTEEFKSRFLTNITHEFRTPLTLIKGHLEIIKEKEEFSHELKRIQEMESSSERLLQLINQLMELSKMEEGKYKLQFQKGYLLNTISTTIDPFYSLAIQKNITFDFKNQLTNDFDIAGFVYAQEALMTIIYNLLSNAFKFTPNGGTVNFTLQYADSDTLVLKVSDTGVGISSENINDVFERFYQVETEDQRTYEGSGIGLAFVKELALLHDGNVRVESKEGEGTTFRVELKSSNEAMEFIQRVEHKKYTEKIISFEDANENSVDENTPIVLVVEDQIEIRKLIVENLNESYQFLEAENGQKGIELAEQYLPDLIISDIMMPDVDGFELCKHLKNNMATSHIPIILLTAKADMSDKILGLEIGAEDYLTKPFSLAEVKLKIRNILQSRALFRKIFQNKAIISKDKDIDEFNQKEREFIEKLEKVVLNHIDNPQFGVPKLAEEMYLSSSQLTRKLNSLIDTSPAKYIRTIRLTKAKELLKEGFNVSETAWEVGFEDPVYFSKTFKKHFGEAPSHLKN